MDRESDSSGNPGEQKPGVSIASILGLSMFLGLIVGAGAGAAQILPVTLISALILYFNRDKIAASETPENGAQKSAKPAQGTYVWPELDQFTCAISAQPYQQTIAQLVQENGIDFENAASAQSHILRAHLIPDNSNPYDSDMVRVNINSHTVGYFDHQPARNFLDQLEEKGLSGQITICNAMITKSADAVGKKPNYGVRLDIELIK
ncbi:hypothetical protein [Nitrosomonas sp.]|uniref:hypothetical protein n=1 Tax=Nitrosomonas sp. TaxID=42353 RepID=UPI0025E0AE3A|nr:hypothetical protein [Nitrosomonas sp.]MBV6448670.1 hypothetical protein [Nitrosomonas sp.]